MKLTGSSVSRNIPKGRKKISWMETAATALTELAKDANNKEDEWVVYRRDVANSLSLQNKDLQHRVKFSIQSTIFHAIQSVDVREPV